MTFDADYGVPALINRWNIYFNSRRDTSSRTKIFNEIWEQYHKRLFFFIGNMVGEEAEDLLQEIMLKVYQNIEKFNPLYSFNTWIYTVARYHCIHFLEKKKRIKKVQYEEIVKKDDYAIRDNPENQMVRKELHHQIEHFLEQLEPAYQQMSFLRFYEGMKIKEIAKLMNVPTGTVKSRIHLIKKTLKKELEEYDAN